jgi:hypothetical protein
MKKSEFISEEFVRGYWDIEAENDVSWDIADDRLADGEYIMASQ